MGNKIIDWVELRYKYLKEQNPSVSDEVLKRKASEQVKTVTVTLPRNRALEITRSALQSEIDATKKLAKMMGKRKPLSSVLRWAEILEDALGSLEKAT